jgi:3-methyladenine DNA glycosylase/8-oxoguanine DNA glycosylase
MVARSFRLDGALDLRRTVSALGMKASGQSVASTSEAWWTTRTPEGPATLHVAWKPPLVEAEAWGSGAQWALEAAPHLVGAEDRPDTFSPPEGLVRDLHRRMPGLRIAGTRRVFEALVPAIIGQKVTTREARSSGKRLVSALGEPGPGPTDLRLLPAPEVLGGLSYWDLHPFGIERKRAATLIEAARRHRRLEEITSMSPAAAAERLRAVRGIGAWTAGHVLGIALGDPDAVPVGDFHLPNTVAYALAGEDRADDERMLELLEPYRGHRRRVMLLLKNAGIKAPKFGPRRELRSIEQI